jgi:mono/diheme cytochrome c family protein
MRITRSLLTASAILTAATAASAQDGADILRRGRTLVVSHCSKCHAIDSNGNSPNREALPLRELSQSYPIEALEEALAEGLSAGHADMPEFTFKSHEISAILAYLQSIQHPKTGHPTSR